MTCLLSAWFQRGDAYFMHVFSYPLFPAAPGNWIHSKGALLSLLPLWARGLEGSVIDSLHDYPFTIYSDIKLCYLHVSGQKLKWEFRKRVESAFDFMNISQISLGHVWRDIARCSLWCVDDNFGIHFQFLYSSWIVVVQGFFKNSTRGKAGYISRVGTLSSFPPAVLAQRHIPPSC